MNINLRLGLDAIPCNTYKYLICIAAFESKISEAYLSILAA